MYVEVPDERRGGCATSLLVLWASMLPGLVAGAVVGAGIGGPPGLVFGTIAGMAYGVPFGMVHVIAQLVALGPANPLRHRARSRTAATVVSVPAGVLLLFPMVTNGAPAVAVLAVTSHAVGTWLLVPRFALPPRHHRRPLPGDGTARRRSPARDAVRWHALAFGLVTGVAAFAGTVRSVGMGGLALYAALVASLFGSVAGVATGLVHAAVQAVLGRRLHPDARHPARELAAVVVSFALALVTLSVVALRSTADDRELATWLACCAAYVGLTWPAAKRAFRPPGDRARERR